MGFPLLTLRIERKEAGLFIFRDGAPLEINTMRLREWNTSTRDTVLSSAPLI